MTTIFTVLLAVFGAALGSFLSVITHRMNVKKKGMLLGRSECPHCKKPLKWNHLIPILSYLALQGECAYCKKRISKHYLLLEAFTATVFVLLFLNWNFLVMTKSLIDPSIINYSIDWGVFAQFLFFTIEAVLLIAIFFYDMKHKEIPDRFSIPAIVVGFAAAFVFGTPEIASILWGLLIIAVFFGGQIVLSKGRWLGGGDLRLGALMAVMLGSEKLVLALILSYLIGAIVSIPLLIAGKADGKTALPFGPFLIAGLLISLFAGTDIIDAYLSFIIIP
jgi:leader peptidase (prepilin peptidase) / N-methyltransferase